MKDEFNGSLMKEFISLLFKMYSLEYDDKTMTKAKGVKKYVIKNHISHRDYSECSFGYREYYIHTINSIRWRKQVLYLTRQNKTTLSAYDDKRYMMEDGVTTLPYGHYKITR